MRRLPRIALLAALVAIMPVLAGCSNFDPDSLDVFGLNAKKKLPGKRELLFPGGVPGVTQGIPPEYKEGYHAPALADLPPGDQDATPSSANSAAKPAVAKRAPVEPVRQSNLGKPMRVHKSTAKATHKRKRRVVRRKPKPKPKAEAKASATASQPKGAAAAWPAPTATQQTQGGWPAPTAQQPQQAQGGWPAPPAKQDEKLAPWPAPPPSGTFSK